MPYISMKHRQSLDPLIEKLALQIVHEAQALEYDGAFAGLLNYTCTSLTSLALKIVTPPAIWSNALLRPSQRHL